MNPIKKRKTENYIDEKARSIIDDADHYISCLLGIDFPKLMNAKKNDPLVSTLLKALKQVIRHNKMLEELRRMSYR